MEAGSRPVPNSDSGVRPASKLSAPAIYAAFGGDLAGTRDVNVCLWFRCAGAVCFCCEPDGKKLHAWWV